MRNLDKSPAGLLDFKKFAASRDGGHVIKHGKVDEPLKSSVAANVFRNEALAVREPIALSQMQSELS